MLQAFKNGNQLERDVLQTLLARISNAEAVTAPQTNEPSVGVGSSEMARKELSRGDILALINDEINKIETVLKTLDAASDYAKELQQKLLVTQKYVS